MRNAGYRWKIEAVGDGWRWRAVSAEDGGLLVEGVARSRAEAALCLARAMSMATADQASLAA
jgi:hypothetical protein